MVVMMTIAFGFKILIILNLAGESYQSMETLRLKILSINIHTLSFIAYTWIKIRIFLETLRKQKIGCYPLSNFSPEKLTSVLMTGTTAMVRNFALNIENEGVNYPGKNISKILADC